MPTIYAWTIDKDHLFDPKDDTDVDDSGTQGPEGAPADLLEALGTGEGRQFQMLDADGELYYTGRILVRGQADTSWTGRELEDFRPLWDFGRPRAGAVDIQYRNDEGDWQSL